MIEGKKISALTEATSLNDACCFPVLNRGATRRITFAKLMQNIINNLPPSHSEEIEEIQRVLARHQTEIEALEAKGATIDEIVQAVQDIRFQVDGQNRTILEYSNTVEEFEQALLIASEYRYVRLFADEGQMMLDLLRIYKMHRKDSPIDDKYIRDIRRGAMDVAERFPMYLHTETKDEISLTKTEKRVLELISEGLSNEDIGKELDKKEGTIKCHTANIYKKFGVANRQQAINFAKDNGIIS